MSRRELHLNINILNSGFYGSAWRAPARATLPPFVDIQHYVRNARIAERGTFDAVFLADTPSFADRPEHRPTMRWSRPSSWRRSRLPPNASG